VSVGLGLEFRGAQARLEGVGGRVILAGTTSTLNQIDVIAGGTATVAVPLVAAAGLLKTGAGALVLTGSGGPAGPTTIRGGAVVVAHETALASGTVRIESGGTVRVAPGLSASLGGLRLAGGTLDVSNGRVSLRSGSYDPVAIQAGLQSGRGGGDWRGPAGVTSTAVAAADGPAPRGVGWLAESDGAMVLAYAAPGDTNLDWQVDLLDTANFLAAGQFDSSSLATWSEGDFTYDGLVDILDAADFLSTGLYDAGGYNGSGAAGVAAVPEPAVWVITAVVPALVAGAAARRRACRSRR
jgi:autotransporter-associated beta strand protein